MTTSSAETKKENLCSIFHAKFKTLRNIIPNVGQAQLMDYILLGWQTSTYKLKKSNQKWFMKPYSLISEETGLPLSTLKRYLKEFEESGFIERQQHLYSRSTEFGFEVKKGCYITITPKLLNLVNSKNLPIENASNNCEQPSINKNPSQSKETVKRSKRKDFDEIETFEKPNLSRSYIRNLYSNLNNNINSNNLPTTEDKSEYSRIQSVLTVIQNTLYKDIKEEIPDEVKTLVFSTFVNLVVKDKIFLSSPKQVVAEYIFALINYDFFIKNVQCIKHRNNILAKLLRNNVWKTPKGFYKHFYLGENFKDKNKIRENWWKKTKENEIQSALNIGYLLDGTRDPRLVEVENRMQNIVETMDQFKENLCNLREENEILDTRKKISELTNELHQLWDIQEKIEKQIETERNQKEVRAIDIAVA